MADLRVAAGEPVGGRPAPVEPPRKHIVLAVHGIRTHGEWMVKLKDLLRAEGRTTEVKCYSYGVFSVIGYVLPFTRWIRTRQFVKELESIARAPGNQNARIDIVAHSFGTHMVGHALAALARRDWREQQTREQCNRQGGHALAAPGRRESPVRVDTVVLAGSVLSVWFPWQELIMDGYVRRVVNECGTRDFILLVTQLFVPFTGMAGRSGFRGWQDDNLKNRYHVGYDHSDYFQELRQGKPHTFMRDWWVPVLTTAETVRDGATQQAKWYTPAAEFLTQHADPLKIAALLIALFVAVKVVVLNPRAEAKAAKAALDKHTAVVLSAMTRTHQAITASPLLQESSALRDTRNALLTSVANTLKELTNDVGDTARLSDSTRFTYAKAQVKMAELATTLSDGAAEANETAANHYRGAIATLDKSFVEADVAPADIRIVRGVACSGLADALLRLRGTGRVTDTDVLDTLAQAEREYTQLQSQPALYSEVRGFHAWVHVNRAKLRAAMDERLKEYQAAESILAEAAGPDVNRDRAWLRFDLGMHYHNNGQPDKAIGELERSRQLFQSLTPPGAGDEQVRPSDRENLGRVSLNLGRAKVRRAAAANEPAATKWRDAVDNHKAACVEFDKLAKLFPDDTPRLIGAAYAWKDFGDDLHTAAAKCPGEDFESEAERAYRNALVYFTRLTAKGVDTASGRESCSDGLGWVLINLCDRRPEDKVALAGEAVKLFETAIDLTPPNTAPGVVAGHQAGLTRAKELLKTGTPP